MSNTKYTFKHASLTDVGLVRQLNEDRELMVNINPDCVAYIVCDGMGGHDCGDKASEAAVRFISEYLTTKPIDNASIALANAIKFANQQIYFESKVSPTNKGMGTTAVVMLQYQDEIHIGHVGDSRAYRFHKNKLTQITKDHSVVQEMVDQGLISQSQAEHHPRKNEITKALGIRLDEEPTISKNVKAIKGERIVLCSDGLSGLISHEMFTKTLQTLNDPIACALQLIKLAKQGGGHDNITVQIIDVLESPHKQVKETKLNQNLMLSIAACFVGIIALSFVYLYNNTNLLVEEKSDETTQISKPAENPVIKEEGWVNKKDLIDLLKYTKKPTKYKKFLDDDKIDSLKENKLISAFNEGNSTYKLEPNFAAKVLVKKQEELNVSKASGLKLTNKKNIKSTKKNLKKEEKKDYKKNEKKEEKIEGKKEEKIEEKKDEKKEEKIEGKKDEKKEEKIEGKKDEKKVAKKVEKKKITLN